MSREHERASLVSERSALIAAAASLSLMLAACGSGKHAGSVASGQSVASKTATTASAPKTAAASKTATSATARRARPTPATLTALPKPADLTPFGSGGASGDGRWRAAGRRVDGVPAVYETTLVPPGGTQPAGIAWMDTHLLSARLYSGSKSPGGGPYRYTAPIQQADAHKLVAAFNGGFMMNAAEGGYYTEGRVIDQLRAGAASLVIYANGSVDVGAWGSDVRMTPQVVAVRQNLLPLVAAGRPTPLATSANWQAWGNTCGASSCASSVPGIKHQWRSGVGVTSDGALVYGQGPALGPAQLADILVRAGVVRGMELDINPDWPIFAAYNPSSPDGLAGPSNGQLLLRTTVRGPDTFFDASWARDFVAMFSR